MFLRVERYGSQPRVFSSRSFMMSCGEDERGAFVASSPQHPYFSVCCVGENYLLNVQAQGMTLNGKALEIGSTTRVRDGDSIGRGDATMTILFSSALAEVAARCGASPELTLESEFARPELPSLIIHIATLRREFPLPRDFAITVGSDPSCAICLDVPAVASTHFLIQNDGRLVHLHPQRGALFVDGNEITTPIALSNQAVLKLVPPGLEMSLHFPQR